MWATRPMPLLPAVTKKVLTLHINTETSFWEYALMKLNAILDEAEVLTLAGRLNLPLTRPLSTHVPQQRWDPAPGPLHKPHLTQHCEQHLWLTSTNSWIIQLFIELVFRIFSEEQSHEGIKLQYEEQSELYKLNPQHQPEDVLEAAPHPEAFYVWVLLPATLLH